MKLVNGQFYSTSITGNLILDIVPPYKDSDEVTKFYVAINAQYHDYCELFEKWFGKGNFDDMIFESAISFWFDDIDFGEDKLWKYFNELK